VSCHEYLGCANASEPDAGAGAAGATTADGNAVPGSELRPAAQDRSVGSGEAGATPSLPSSLRCGPICPFRQVLTGVTPIVARDETQSVRGCQDSPFRRRTPALSFQTWVPSRSSGSARGPRHRRAQVELRRRGSHELRTPLALISGYAQSLLELDLDEVARASLHRTNRRTANRMRGLVDQLLDVATLESDRLAVDPRPDPASAPPQSIIDRWPRCPAHSRSPCPFRPTCARLCRPDPNRPSRGKSARQRPQVRDGGVDDHRAGPASGRPGVRDHRQRRAGDRPEERASVFRTLLPRRDARSSGTPGIGLGLHLSRRLVEAHGGHIRLGTTGGTCVSLSLPPPSRAGRLAAASVPRPTDRRQRAQSQTQRPDERPPAGAPRDCGVNSRVARRQPACTRRR